MREKMNKGRLQFSKNPSDSQKDLCIKKIDKMVSVTDNGGEY